MTEGLNSANQKIKATARGFRNFAHFRTRVLFFLGTLDLTPQIAYTRLSAKSPIVFVAVFGWCVRIRNFRRALLHRRLNVDRSARSGAEPDELR